MLPYIAPGINPQQAVQYNHNTNKLAIWSMAAAFVFAPVGIILGFVALAQMSTRPQPGRGLAITGIALGFFFIVVQIVVLVLFWAWATNTAEMYQQ